ncbi:MAG TPA: hypothetical protein VK039_03530, partial [Brevibacterium sp.]|nr:hypothetical protein [Brevibacterium sp.]
FFWPRISDGPFPASLMLGFTVEADTLTTAPDDDEITALRWFTRPQLRAAMESGEVTVPGTVSIAGQILHGWLDGVPQPATTR